MAAYNLHNAYRTVGTCRCTLLPSASIQTTLNHFQPARHCVKNTTEFV